MRSKENAFTDALLDLKCECFIASQLISLNSRADEFEFVTADALFDELFVSNLSLCEIVAQSDEARVLINPITLDQADLCSVT